LRINLGIIGAGRIGKIHAMHLAHLPGVRVKAISDIQVDQIKPWAEQLGIPVITNRNEEVMEDPDIHAVLICSPTDTHPGLIRRLAALGKHIFCEKPISFDYKQTKQVIDEVAKAGVLLQTGFNRRFDANFMRVKQAIVAGDIGRPHLIKVTSRDPEPPPYEYIRSSGGLLLDMSIHDLDMVRYLSGSEVEEIYAQGAVLVDPKIGELGDIDTAVIMLKLMNGMLGVIDNSRRSVYGYDQRVEVFGSGGKLVVHNEYPNQVEWSTADGTYRDKPKFFFLERYKDSYLAEMLAFVHAIRHRQPVLVDGYDGLQAELLAYAARKSLEEKRPVRISEMFVS